MKCSGFDSLKLLLGCAANRVGQIALLKQCRQPLNGRGVLAGFKLAEGDMIMGGVGGVGVIKCLIKFENRLVKKSHIAVGDSQLKAGIMSLLFAQVDGVAMLEFGVGRKFTRQATRAELVVGYRAA